MRFFDKTRYNLGNRGIALILVAGLIFIFFSFVILALDIAYIYAVRGQLQNAADAGALAGAGLLQEAKGPTEQGPARDEAEKFAQENFAAGELVIVGNILSVNELTDDNDITVGNWSVTNEEYTLGGTPVNAIQVRTRMNTASERGPVGLVFGRVLDWPDMSVAGIAIAAESPGGELPFAVCLDTCDFGEVEKILYWPSPAATFEDPEVIIAWTLLKTIPPIGVGGDANLLAYVCNLRSPEACNDLVYTDHGLKEKVIKTLRCAFKDPDHDTGNKKCVGDADFGDCETGETVEGWRVIVPVLRRTDGADDCPPSVQGNAEPYDVFQWGQITITEVYPKKGGSRNFCVGEEEGVEFRQLNCPDYDPLPDEVLDGTINGAIKISNITCEDCKTASFLNRNTFLVR
jgi:hypothetical protein